MQIYINRTRVKPARDTLETKSKSTRFKSSKALARAARVDYQVEL